MAREHEMTRAHREAIDSAMFYDLVGMRSRLAEDVVAWACQIAFADLGENTDTLSYEMKRSCIRLKAVEHRIAELAPNITFDRKGELWLHPTSTKRA